MANKTIDEMLTELISAVWTEDDPSAMDWEEAIKVTFAKLEAENMELKKNIQGKIDTHPEKTMEPQDGEYWWVKDKVTGDLTIGRYWKTPSSEPDWLLIGYEFEVSSEGYEPISKIEKPKEG